MPLFLTGERQVGKSTALRKALAASGLRCAGVMTRFDTRHGLRALYLLPYSAGAELPEGIDLLESAVCARMGGAGRQVFPQVFDEVGTALLRSAADADVIVLDELGYLESEAAGFREAVLEVLNGPKPVLGVVRQGLGAWADAPLGAVMEVTEANRAEVPEKILAWLREQNTD